MLGDREPKHHPRMISLLDSSLRGRRFGRPVGRHVAFGETSSSLKLILKFRVREHSFFADAIGVAEDTIKCFDKS